MKTILKYELLILLLAGVTGTAHAQATNKKTTTKTTTTPSKAKTTTKKPAPVAPVKEVTITLKNTAERTVGVFIGPKTELKDPKLKTVGGLSTNTIYVKTNEVVCVMSQDGKKILACARPLAGSTYMEINSSATAISVK